MDDTQHETVSMSSLFAGYTMPQPTKKKRTSERTELVRYFYDHAAARWTGNRPLSPGYIGMKLAHLTIQDLYAFKSMCEDRARLGYPWAKYFWGALKEQSWQTTPA